MPTDFFISYSRKDTEFADKLANSLQGRGYTVWIDRGGIDAGMSWRRQIVDAINGSRFFLLILSPNSIVSDNVVKELDIADTNKKTKIPVLCQNTQIPDDMQYQLAGLQFQDFSTGNYDSNFDRLMRALGRLGAPPTMNANAVTPQPPVSAQSSMETKLPSPLPQAPAPVAPKSVARLPIPKWVFAAAAGAIVTLIICAVIVLVLGSNNSDSSTNAGVPTAASTQLAVIQSTQPAATFTPVPSTTSTSTPIIQPIVAHPSSTVAPPTPTSIPSLTPTAAVPVGKIVFSRSEGDRVDDKYIYIMDADGTNVKKIASVGVAPSISPDGNQVTFTRLNDALYIVNADGSNLRKLISDGKIRFSEWSHDGQLIAFSLVNNGGIQVVAVNDPTKRHQITVGDDFSWSPNDQEIVFHTCRASCGLFKVGIGGGDGVQITTDDGQVPAWSPNGKQIIYQKGVNGQMQLFVVNADGTGSKQLTSGNSMHTNAAWSGDGNYIFYRSPEGSGWAIWRMKADGTSPTKIKDSVEPVDWSMERLAVVTK